MKLLDVLSDTPWVMMPAKKQEIDAVYATHLRGEKIDVRAIEVAMGQPLNNQPQGYEVMQGGVAVFDVDGVIAKKMNMFTRISGGVSTEMLASDFQEAMNDPAVTSILLRIDSPGGAVDGVQQMADAVFNARGQGKPIIALADGMMASGGYWIGAAADQVFAASDTTLVGSIGVVATHVDTSGAEAQRGVKTTEITSGKFKRIASTHAPLSPEGREAIQDQTDQIYGVFLDNVAKFRGAASAEAVHEEMADGRVFIGQQAVAAGLVDGVMPFDQLLAQMAAGQDPSSAIPGARGGVRALAGGTKATSAATAGTSTAHAAGVAAESNPTTEETNMAEKTISAEDAKPFVDAAIAEANAAFEVKTSAIRSEGATAGATAERERIQAVLAQKLPGHDVLVESLAFDGKTTGPEAAVAVLSAERAKGNARLSDLKEDANKTAPNALAPKSDGEPVKEVKEEAPHVITKKAQAYIAQQAKLGINVSATEAVAHVRATASSNATSKEN